MSSTIVTPAGFDKASFGDVIRLGAPSGPSLTFVEKGLHVTSIAFKDKNGQEHDIIVGSDDPSHYVDEKKYRHCLVGRYCNRLPSDTPIQVGNQTITLPSHPAPGQSLHGGPGPNAWDDKVLNRVKLDEVKLFSPTEIEYLKEKEKASSAGVWTLTSPDGENGHAGTVLCEVAFVVVETPDEIGQVIAVYRAKLLDGEATALNLTQHWGFNLGASATSKGKPTPASKIGISDHHLKLKTKSILNLDAKDSLPTGTVLPLSSVDEKNFGGEGKTIGHAGKGYPSPSTTEDKMGQGFPGEGYDDFWVFDRAGRTDIAVPEESLSTLSVFKDIEKDSDTLATLSSPESGVSISFTSNQPGLQAWSGAGAFDGSDARKALHGGKSVRGQGDGYVSEAVPILAMEFHAIYGGWMHPQLQKLGWDTILKKGEVYNNWVRMSIQA